MGWVPAVLYTGLCGTSSIESVFGQATYNTIKQGQLNPNQFNCTLVGLNLGCMFQIWIQKYAGVFIVYCTLTVSSS